ncbi:MAG: serine/threonine protein kinase [Solirubrobacterales bacterium]|nr:serine/threonine protein kinase [Solirubrobacterales bacterium]
MTPAQAGFCIVGVGRRIGAGRGETGGVIEGEQLLGRFTVGERLGTGGYGTVHRAWDERLCRWVAVKSVEGDAAGRVLREAHAAARLNHPGIVTLYELGSHNGTAYLVSELIEGPNLRELATSGALSDREVADFGAELCGALEHAHAAGVIHRDVKPDNVLIRPGASRLLPGGSKNSGERAVLADFGIARIDDAASLTATGQVVGTLSYMSPEQAAGAEVAAATDVYSLALTLYELWAGFNPVLRTTPAATARAIGEPVEPLWEMRPDLPPELADAVDACLVADPDERPGLAQLRESLVTMRAELSPDRAVPEPLADESETELVAALPRRPLAVLLAATAAIVGAAVVGVPGIAIVAAVLLAPAAVLLARPAEWLLPALAPVFGLLGAAPAFLPIAARRESVITRAGLAALAWAWTGIVGTILGHGLGAGTGGGAPGWATSASVAPADVVGVLLDPTVLSIGMIWVGSAILLGTLLDVARPAGAAIGSLIWAGCVSATVAAAGPEAASTFLLAPALVLSIGWAIWDAAGRPELGEWMPEGHTPRGLLALFDAGQGLSEHVRDPHEPRNPADAPMADDQIRATRAARRHVRAALHGAGSRGGLP